jgi:hypothetical protein
MPAVIEVKDLTKVYRMGDHEVRSELSSFGCFYGHDKRGDESGSQV